MRTLVPPDVKRAPAALRAFLQIALPVIIGSLGTGCGAMFNQEAAVVPIYVNPPGAKVYVDGQFVGPAPTNVSMPNKTPHTITVEADGYERQTTQIDSHVNGGFVVLDCLFLVALVVPGLIALVVDGSTGDWRALDRDSMSFALVPVRPQKAPAWPAYRGPVIPVPPPTRPPSVPSPAGCQYDNQCKGDRICVGGKCLPPPGTPSDRGSDSLVPPAE